MASVLPVAQNSRERRDEPFEKEEIPGLAAEFPMQRTLFMCLAFRMGGHRIRRKGAKMLFCIACIPFEKTGEELPEKNFVLSPRRMILHGFYSLVRTRFSAKRRRGPRSSSSQGTRTEAPRLPRYHSASKTHRSRKETLRGPTSLTVEDPDYPLFSRNC